MSTREKSGTLSTALVYWSEKRNRLEYLLQYFDSGDTEFIREIPLDWFDSYFTCFSDHRDSVTDRLTILVVVLTRICADHGVPQGDVSLDIYGAEGGVVSYFHPEL